MLSDQLSATSATEQENGRFATTEYLLYRPAGQGPSGGHLDLGPATRLRRVFGTHGLVKVAGTVDGRRFTGAFTARGDRTHKLPIAAPIRTAINKNDGDDVEVHFTERHDRLSRCPTRRACGGSLCGLGSLTRFPPRRVDR